MTNSSLICNFIRAHPDDWEKLLDDKKITIKHENELAIFKYGSEADFSEPLVREARGIIIDVDKAEVRCVAFDKFGNYQESYAADIDWNTAVVQDKIDGSIVKLWSYRGKWRWSTNGTIDAADASANDSLTYQDVINQAVNIDRISFEALDQTKTYIFELVSPVTQVVIKYPMTKLIHIGTRSNKTMQESNDWIGIEKPNTYSLGSLKECVEAAKNLNSNQQVSKEGFVVVDGNWDRIKIKSPEYLALHHMVNNHNYSKDKMIELIRSGANIEELILNFPDCAHIIRYYQWQIEELRYNATKMIYKARSLYNEFSFERKAVANEIKGDRYSALGFMALGNERSVDEILSSLTDAQFNRYINTYEYNW